MTARDWRFVWGMVAAAFLLACSLAATGRLASFLAVMAVIQAVMTVLDLWRPFDGSSHDRTP